MPALALHGIYAHLIVLALNLLGIAWILVARGSVADIAGARLISHGDRRYENLRLFEALVAALNRT
jgi:hypothetical protein